MNHLTFAVVGCWACVTAAQLPPVGPKAPAKPHVLNLHGQKRVDNYFWLRDKNDPQTRKYLEAENANTAAITKASSPLVDKLYAEMLGRIQQTDATVPARRGKHLYFSRTIEGKQYPILCRKKDDVGPEEILLDLNVLAKGKPFLGLGAFAVSDDERMLAYAIDLTGFREYEFHLKDLATGKPLPEQLGKVVDLEWSADGSHIWYIVEDAAKRDYRIYRHRIGAPKSDDVLVYEEKDELFTIGMGATLDRKYLVVGSQSSESTEMRYIDRARPTDPPRVLRPREDKHRYRIAGHRAGKFFVLSNKAAKNFRLVAMDVPNVSAPTGEWTEVVPHRDAVLLGDATVFADFMVLAEKENGLDRLVVMPAEHGKSKLPARKEISMPEPSYQLGQGENFMFAARRFRYEYSSPTTPRSTLEYDIDSGTSRLLKQRPTPGYVKENYVVERVWVTARDGVRVPMTIVHKKGLVRNGAAPCLMYGYGAYGYGAPADFDSEVVSLLDRGFVFAIAHIRGGNELGEPWHDDGKMMKKKNTFFDFIDCGNWLCDNGYTAHRRLGIHGASAGGLLIGATLNLAPVDFCAAAVLQVPFVDVINTMLDESLPLTVQEFLEWGNPKMPREFNYMNSYCPYSNLSARPYPAMLVLTSLNDSQVLFHEPAKYVAKLRELKTDSNPLIFRCNMDAGHGGASGRYDNLKETAFLYAFLITQLQGRPAPATR